MLTPSIASSRRPSPNSLWGKNLSPGRARGFGGEVSNFFDQGAVGKDPRATSSRRARAPKPTAFALRIAVETACGFRTVLALFSGCDSCGTGSRDCSDRRTLPSLPCGRRCGQRPSPWRGALALRTRGRTARAGAASASDRASTCRSGTSSARTAPRRCAGRRAAGGHCNSHRSPTRSSPGVGMAAAASGSRAITSAKNRKPAPTQTALADHVAQALRHRHSSIFTMDSFPQILQ